MFLNARLDKRIDFFRKTEKLNLFCQVRSNKEELVAQEMIKEINNNYVVTT